jgi:DNA-binding MarR family transcriptional regulator
LNPLMATIVLPYRGHTAAARELARPQRTVVVDSSRRPRGGASVRPTDSHPANSGFHPANSGFRLTVRRQMVLAAVAELGGRGSNPSNREVADLAGIADQGQISRLLARLEGLGLVQNTGGENLGVQNAWQLTAHGEEIARAGSPTTGNPPAGSSQLGSTPAGEPRDPRSTGGSRSDTPRPAR